MAKIKIDDEFRSLIPPISADELTQLEENLKQGGCRDPLVIWAGGNILLDGHNRLEICTRNGIDYEVTDVVLDGRDDAKIWIIRNQFGRRNLQPFQRVELIMKLKPLLEAKAKEQQRGGQGGVLLNQIPGEANVNVNKALAKEAGVSHDYVHKAGVIIKYADEETKEALRKGKKKITSEYARIKKEVPGAVKPWKVTRTPRKPDDDKKPKTNKPTQRQRDEFYDGAKAIYELTRVPWLQISVVELKSKAEQLWLAVQKYYG